MTDETVDLYRATEEEWAAHVTLAFAENPLQSVLPVTQEPGCSLLNFAQGSLGEENGNPRGSRLCRPNPVMSHTRHAAKALSRLRCVRTRTLV